VSTANLADRKETEMVPNLQQTGRSAAAAGALMLVGVEGEWLLDPQSDDGSVTNLPVFVLLVLVATVGFALLCVAVVGLRAHAAPRRSARVGARLSLLGAGLMLAFGASTVASAIATGSPWEAAFVAFLVGMLLLGVGAVTWGLSLRRHSSARGTWRALSIAGGAAFVALATESDPWHDLALSAMFLSWSLVGVLVLRLPRGRSTTFEAGRELVV
jgi:MFS family permease